MRRRVVGKMREASVLPPAPSMLRGANSPATP
jgi:hypothetical protein